MDNQTKGKLGILRSMAKRMERNEASVLMWAHHVIASIDAPPAVNSDESIIVRKVAVSTSKTMTRDERNRVAKNAAARMWSEEGKPERKDDDPESIDYDDYYAWAQGIVNAIFNCGYTISKSDKIAAVQVK